MKRARVLVATLVGSVPLALAGLFPAIVSADSVNINFEPTTYSVGDINGQDGWMKTGPYDAAVVNNTYGYGSFGTQSLRISNAVTSGSFGDQTFSKSLTNEAGESDALNGGLSGGVRQPHFEAQFSVASTSSAQQPGLFLSVSPDRGDGARMSYVGFDDQADGVHVIFYDVTDPTHAMNADTFNKSDIATISRAPHVVKISMDFLDGPDNDVVRVYIDGALKHTGTSWEDYYRYDTESNPGLANNNSRTVDSLLFRAGGTAAPATAGNGFLFDNLSLSSGAFQVPTSKDQCKNNGWQQFVSPSFKNQGQCIDWVQAKATADLRMAGPSQRIKFNVANQTGHGKHDHRNTVEYWNYDYPGGLHYTADVACSYVNPQTKETRFMFQIPAGHPGLSGLYVVAYAKEVNGHNTPDLYGHAATGDLATATQWCQTGNGFSPAMYPVTKGNVEVE